MIQRKGEKIAHGWQSQFIGYDVSIHPNYFSQIQGHVFYPRLEIDDVHFMIDGAELTYCLQVTQYTLEIDLQTVRTDGQFFDMCSNPIALPAYLQSKTFPYTLKLA